MSAAAMGVVQDLVFDVLCILIKRQHRNSHNETSFDHSVNNFTEDLPGGSCR